MKFSIITICLNAEKVIEKTIQSIVNQTFQNFEFIIIDGKSTDNTLAIIEKYKSRVNILISEKDSGIFNAQNKGIKKSSGEYLIFMNAGDCIYEKDTLEKIANSSKNEDILYGDIMNDFGFQSLRLRTYPERIGYNHWYNDFLCHQACAIKKSLFDRFGLYAENFRYAADHDFFYRVWFKKNITKKHLPIIFCLFDMNGISGNPENEKKVMAEIRKSQRENFSFYILLFLKIRKYFANRKVGFFTRKIINLYRLFMIDNEDRMSSYKAIQDRWRLETDKIKVLHICNSDYLGGAARGAYRIYESLPRDLVSPIMLVQIKNKYNDPNVILCIRKSGFKRLGEIFQNKFYATFHIKRFRTTNSMLHSIEYLSEFDIIESINILKPDVVHLHWVQHNFFKIEDIGKISVPIVWTLHDMWPFCGAEHYTFDKRYIEGYKSENQPSYESGFDLNKWVWMRKKKHWEKIISKLYAIGVSTWVTGEASKSNLFQKTRTATIWNSLDTRVFFPMDKDLCRKKMGFPLGVKLILAGAINFSGDSRKGTNYLLEAIKLLSEQKNHEDYCLILFGSDIFVRGLGIPIINLGKIDNDNELTTIYSAADVMVVPSLQETFGQTAIEAMACATPVVCFDTTGLRDIVDHKENGYRAKCFDPDDLLEGIKWVTGEEENQKKLSENALAKVNRNFTYKTMGSNYLEIYKRLTS